MPSFIMVTFCIYEFEKNKPHVYIEIKIFNNSNIFRTSLRSHLFNYLKFKGELYGPLMSNEHTPIAYNSYYGKKS